MSGSKTPSTHLSEGIIIRYTNSGIKETRSLASVQAEGAATRGMIVIIGTRRSLIFPDASTHKQKYPTGAPRVFAAKDREHVARRDLGRCRSCGIKTGGLYIRYLGERLQPNILDAIHLICMSCDSRLDVKRITPIAIGIIRDQERQYRIENGIPLTLNTQKVLTEERNRKRELKDDKVRRLTGSLVTKDQILAIREIREDFVKRQKSEADSQKQLAIDKANRRNQREQDRRELMASMCGPVLISTPNGTMVTVMPAYTADQLARIVKERLPIDINLRERIARRDKGLCRYCLGTADEFEIDHVIPVVAGGHTIMSNLVLACKDCNRRKGPSTDYEKWKPKPLSRVNEIAGSWGAKNLSRPPAAKRQSRGK